MVLTEKAKERSSQKKQKVASSTVKGSPPVQSRSRIEAKENISTKYTEGIPSKTRLPENLKSFTLEATIEPTEIKKKQFIVGAEYPPSRLELKHDGTVVGSVHTTRGWESVNSGARKIGKNERVSLRLVREESGKLSLEINDRHANSVETEKNIAKAASGKKDKEGVFAGKVSNTRMRRGAITGLMIDGYKQKATTLADQLKHRLNYQGNLEVFVDPDTVDHRFDEIKAILNSAGVADISELGTLTIDQPTTIVRNQVMIAPPKEVTPSISWGEAANLLATASMEKAVEFNATLMANRNSSNMLNKMINPSEYSNGRTAGEKTDESATEHFKEDIFPFVKRVLPTSKAKLSKSPEIVLYKKGADKALKEGSRVARTMAKPLLTELIKPAQGIEIEDPDLIQNLSSEDPNLWPVFEPPTFFSNPILNIPVHTSVIIAGQLDLTNQTLVIEPDVETLYIIAEEIIGGPNAKITWRKPGGFTASRLDDPNKNGRSYSGVHTADGSRNGLPGGDGLDGDPGYAAADGIDAPNLELWVKNLTAMPDIDLNGEEGIKGGRGQRGGRGGNGAKGVSGQWWWFFGIQCWKNPGHGGDGGDGGRGGRGGRGGDGGDGGNISIGVLEDTLADTVQAKAFKLKNQGGDVGRGGDGGSGGLGGYGGPHGNDYHDGQLVCGTGQDGDRGAQGQPGPDGNDGRTGYDANLRFFEFTEESWNEQLTKPYLYDLDPSEVMPGEELNITGTRFADADRLYIGSSSYNPTINADETISLTIPSNMSGGEKDLYVRRYDGVESNHLRFWVKPRLDLLPTELAPEMLVTITGRAFKDGAKVVYNGELVDATFVSKYELQFMVPGTGGVSTEEADITVAVRNPDGLYSNERGATVARTLDSGIRIGVHDFAFDNFAAGDPSWGTFEDTFGALEVWHQLLDPVFGHPVLTPLFYAFYHHFLEGEDNGGLATGFCTAMSAVMLDEYHTGSTDTHARYVLDDATREKFTWIHGRLLSRESLLDFHDQGQRGNANVETVFRRIEANLRDGSDRNSALMLFFVPSGSAWDEGYFDMLGDSHCIVPIRMVYPVGHDGSSIDGVTMYCWDCNHPIVEGEAAAHNCRLVFRETDGEVRYDYYDGGSSVKFRSEDGITLASMTNGKYYLSDHDLPFSGPLGLTRFAIDFLMSPADLLVEDTIGNRTGLEGSNILSEIPNSHPSYFAKNFYMLPADQALTRRIKGNDNGNYNYYNILPNGTSISLEQVGTSIGEEDVLSVNADSSQIRFTPGSMKNFRLNLAKEVNGQVRAVSVENAGAGPASATDLTISPDLSIVRLGNRETARNVDVRVSAFNKESGGNATLDQNGVNLPNMHDLLVTVTDWDDLALTVRSLPFETE